MATDAAEVPGGASTIFSAFKSHCIPLHFVILQSQTSRSYIEMKRCIAYLIVFLTCTIVGTTATHAQISGPLPQRNFTDSLRQEFDNAPYFSLYKDNYFTVGTALGQRPTRTNSDVKFQISISQRLTRSTLPWNTYLFLFYTQKTFWNVFEKSMPMFDMNFNPGIGLTKPLFSTDRYIGKVTLLVEHESNGRDSVQSRSWNRVSLAASIVVDDWLMVHGKIWLPIIDGENNRDILNYCGIWQNGVSIRTPNRKFQWDLTMVKRRGWNLNFNTIFEFSWRVNKRSNQYIFVQYYNGYGENLLDYNVFHSRLRVGFVIKPKFFSDY